MNRKPLVMGILNATPDSFYDGGRYDNLEQRGLQLIADGADWIDIGGESTRPGAESISVEEECKRVLPVIAALRGKVPLSIDTSKPEVARRAALAGATILNDVRGLSSPGMIDVTAHFETTIVMHSRGTPKTMTSLTKYENLIEEVISSLCESAKKAKSPRVWIDPGIGFAKTPQQSLMLLKNTSKFVDTGYPVLLGASRKSFIGHTIGRIDSEDRLAGSLAAVAAGFYSGATAFRVHDVRETTDLIRLLWEISQTR